MVALVAEVLLGEGFDDGDSAGGRHLFFFAGKAKRGKGFSLSMVCSRKNKEKRILYIMWGLCQINFGLIRPTSNETFRLLGPIQLCIYFILL